MNKYLRTKDGRIIDLQKFIEEEKKNPYYTDYEFEEIKNEEDSCSIYWTAIGTEENSQKDQVGRRCQFGATVSSPFIAQADTIEELSDEFVYNDKAFKNVIYENISNVKTLCSLRKEWIVYAAIWTDKGLLYVAKMKEILPNGEIDWELV